jgi:hypothetical protein
MTDILPNMKPGEVAAILREQPGESRFPGAMLMSYGPQSYVGAVIAITGTLYFEGGYTPEKREAICRCFDEYQALAGDNLTWLWRDEPPSGPPLMPYRQAAPLRDTLKGLGENDQVSFHYTGGIQKDDASPYTFYVHGLRAWKAKKGNGLDVLRFSLPFRHVAEHPARFQALFVDFARHVQALHGHGGFGFIVSPSDWHQDQPTEAFLSPYMPGADLGEPVLMASVLTRDTIKTVSWLTAINGAMLERIGGARKLRSDLPPDWFALYDYGAGVVIQAGNEPEIAAPASDGKLALYVLPNMILKDLRSLKSWLHVIGSDHGELRMTGVSADEWMRRFDVPEIELTGYKAKLADAPKLKASNKLKMMCD